MKLIGNGNNESVKGKGYVKTLKLKRDDLTRQLAGLKPGTDEFNNTKSAIADIDKILLERRNGFFNGLKVGGMLLLTAVGLGLSHKDDIGETIPGKYVSKAVDGLLNRISK